MKTEVHETFDGELIPVEGPVIMEHRGQKFRLPPVSEFSYVEYLAAQCGTYFKEGAEDAAREHTHGAIVAAIDQRQFARNFDPARQHFAGFLVEEEKDPIDVKAQRYHTWCHAYDGAGGPAGGANDRLRAINKEAKAKMDKIEAWFCKKGIPIPPIS